jgi:hypothetical protein
MDDPVVEPGRPAPPRGVALKALLLAAFAAATFLSGRLWSLREVREARRAAGLAEGERLVLQAELSECRNALLLLHRERGEATGGDDREGNGANPSRARPADPTTARAVAGPRSPRP